MIFWQIFVHSFPLVCRAIFQFAWKWAHFVLVNVNCQIDILRNSCWNDSVKRRRFDCFKSYQIKNCDWEYYDGVDLIISLIGPRHFFPPIVRCISYKNGILIHSVVHVSTSSFASYCLSFSFERYVLFCCWFATNVLVSLQ